MSYVLKNHTPKIHTLVENRTVYHSDSSELNIFETYKVAEKIDLTFDNPVIASMIQGKKIMYLDGIPHFDFFKGESVVIPSEQQMIIDFPEASMVTPTICMALEIDSKKISETVSYFNASNKIYKDDNNSYEFELNPSHLNHNKDIDILVNRLIETFTKNSSGKDVLLDLMIKELVVRLLQTKAKSILLNSSNSMLNNNRIAFILNYIQEHLTEKLTIENLAEKVHLSSSHFYKIFRNTVGESAVDFINQERIKLARSMILNSNKPISEIAFFTGFNNVSYFNRQFKRFTQLTPSQFKKKNLFVEGK